MAKQYIVVNRNGTQVAGPFTRKVSADYEIDKLHKATRRIKSFWHVEQIEKEPAVVTAKKKPSAAQLAARKLFAQRAKAGTLGGKRKTKRVATSVKRVSTAASPKKKRAPVARKLAATRRLYVIHRPNETVDTAWGWFENKQDAVDAARVIADRDNIQLAVSVGHFPK